MRTSIASCVVVAVLLMANLAVADIAIVPKPVKLQAGTGTFTVTGATPILIETGKAEAADAGHFLADTVATASGMKLAVKASDSATPVAGAILLTTKNADASLGDEGYQLDATDQGVTIRSTGGAGLFYGVQTLLQLMPPAIYSQTPVNGVQWTVQAASVTDQPRFHWRGLMVDVARHFEPKEAVERILDEMAWHKLNVMHWHLVDDQGWRIEIKKYPKLTEMGAWRPDAGFGLDPKLSTTYGPDGRYGGFYTQDQIREVVKYAAKLHITIVPEIEMPGHSTAALSAYPELSTTGGPFTIHTSRDIFNAVYSPANPQTYVFLQDVLTEVMDLFPSTYIHVGGDEVPPDSFDDAADKKLAADNHLTSPAQVEVYLINKMSKFIEAHGRKLIGWDEILNPDLASNAAVMSWRGTANGKLAAEAGHDVVMSPTDYVYLDYEQSRTTEPQNLTGENLPLDKVYSFDPIEGLNASDAKHIIGVQANLWTEYVPNLSYAEYLTWPRTAALAEIGWTPANERNYDDFVNRIKTEELRLDAAGVNYRPVEDETIQHIVQLSATDPSKMEINPGIAGAEIYYTLDHSYPTRQSAKYDGPMAPPKGWADMKIAVFRPGSKAEMVFLASVLDGRPVKFTSTLQRDAIGGNAHPADLFWTERPPAADDNIVITFDTPQVLHSATVHTGGIPGYSGSALQNGVLEVSTDGTTFTSLGTFSNGAVTADLGGKTIAAVRIRVLQPQASRIIVRDITLK